MVICSQPIRSRSCPPIAVAKVLVACEYSGVVRDAFIEAGHDAWSCDLLQPEGKYPDRAYIGLVEGLLHGDIRWDLLIAHPPCTYLSVSGMHWTRRGLRDPQLTEDALDFVRLLMAANVPHIALENPVSIISSRIRKPDQIIQPYEFGDDASKRTCLWLKNLPVLVETQRVPGRVVNGKERWSNQTDSGQNKLSPGERRAKDRSKTYPGIAAAMADQWGRYVTEQLHVQQQQ